MTAPVSRVPGACAATAALCLPGSCAAVPRLFLPRSVRCSALRVHAQTGSVSRCPPQDTAGEDFRGSCPESVHLCRLDCLRSAFCLHPPVYLPHQSIPDFSSSVCPVKCLPGFQLLCLFRQMSTRISPAFRCARIPDIVAPQNSSPQARDAHGPASIVCPPVIIDCGGRRWF